MNGDRRSAVDGDGDAGDSVDLSRNSRDDARQHDEGGVRNNLRRLAEIPCH